METIIEILEYFKNYKDTPISWTNISFASIIGVTLLILFTIYNSKKKEFTSQNITELIIGILLNIAINTILIWIIGPFISLLSTICSLICSIILPKKLLKSDQVSESASSLNDKKELATLQKNFKKTPNFSILEILLYYGYISSMQKDFVEFNDIFSTPEEMAKKFLTTPILTEKQYKEAMAIMNVIRIEGKIVSKKEALLIIELYKEKGIENSEE